MHPEAARRQRWPEIPPGSSCHAGVYAGPCPGRRAAACHAVGHVDGGDDDDKVWRRPRNPAAGGDIGDGDAVESGRAGEPSGFGGVHGLVPERGGGRLHRVPEAVGGRRRRCPGDHRRGSERRGGGVTFACGCSMCHVNLD